MSDLKRPKAQNHLFHKYNFHATECLVYHSQVGWSFPGWLERSASGGLDL